MRNKRIHRWRLSGTLPDKVFLDMGTENDSLEVCNDVHVDDQEVYVDVDAHLVHASDDGRVVYRDVGFFRDVEGHHGHRL